MMKQKAISLLFFVISFVLSLVLCFSQKVTELTFFVEAKRDICFCEIWEPSQIVNITYHVKDGGKGDLDVNFIVLDPLGNKLIENKRTKTSSINLVPQSVGEYKLCFDNSHSKLHTKTVSFQYFIEEGSDLAKTATIQYAAEEQNYHVSIADLKQTITKLQLNVGQIRYSQKLFKKREDWEKYLVERKLGLVNTYSVVQMAVMLAAGLIQVLMVRSLFDEKSRIHGIWKKRTNR
ncbi:transmembrane emp24 domain-containing protein 1-like [Agrilus planipennis]|uniref:Transmembrane emp24 domain-containing protein 1-like n=1 Tax=Agrilus planipennis TaxID=224129 RepID=A0A1W4W2X8_AGRPL|nr:transmembrane emp24 domain-containing protein 1-like [Agrilus planipennis]